MQYRARIWEAHDTRERLSMGTSSAVPQVQAGSSVWEPCRLHTCFPNWS